MIPVVGGTTRQPRGRASAAGRLSHVPLPLGKVPTTAPYTPHATAPPDSGAG